MVRLFLSAILLAFQSGGRSSSIDDAPEDSCRVAVCLTGGSLSSFLDERVHQSIRHNLIDSVAGGCRSEVSSDGSD